MLVSLRPHAIPALAVSLAAAAAPACVLDYPVGDSPLAGTGGESDGTSTTADVDPTTSEPARCGDGVVDAEEACDDGNDDPADGCDLECNRAPTVGWTHTDGGQHGGGFVPNAIAVDPTGRIVVVGDDLAPDRYGEAAVLVFGPGGNLMWRRSFPTVDKDWNTFTDVVIDSDGRIFAGGFALEDLDFVEIVRCLDATGEELWTFHEVVSGPVQTARLHGLVAGPGGLYSVGEEYGDHEFFELVVRKHDPATGEVAWKLEHQGPGDMVGTSIAVSGDHLVAVGRVTSPIDSLPHPLVVTVDTAGTLVSSASEDQLVGEWSSVAPIGATGDLVLAGYSREPGAIHRNARLRRIDAAGAEVWNFVGDSPFAEFKDVAVGPDEAIVAIGDVDVPGVDEQHSYTRRFTGAGATLWTSHLLAIPGAMNEHGFAVAFSGSTVIAAGMWTEEIDDAPGTLLNLWLRQFAGQ
ncbi:hypothetical protein [Nannocystis radixulma]|uniref:Myxococcus cysteine-rich repeat-containing protein n=1 Tax=Nannocystis radixulma TaxID=2995305 RepID=A0ABT5BE53_9BACT|nr:hypothetical protein [Nannocystis radixulma]MDC0672429.1 hypothetical protein [Nannocystis radixulma]